MKVFPNCQKAQCWKQLKTDRYEGQNYVLHLPSHRTTSYIYYQTPRYVKNVSATTLSYRRDSPKCSKTKSKSLVVYGIQLGDIVSPRCLLTESDISACISPSNVIGIQVTLSWFKFEPLKGPVALFGCEC